MDLLNHHGGRVRQTGVDVTGGNWQESALQNCRRALTAFTHRTTPGGRTLITEPHLGYSGEQIAHAVSLDTHANRFVAASAANHVKLSDPVTLGDAVADLADANADDTITLCDSYKIAVPAMVELGDWEAQHQHNEDEVDELVRRLAELEKRVEAVEQFRGIGGH